MIFRNRALGVSIRLVPGFEPVDLPAAAVAARLGDDPAQRRFYYGFARPPAADGVPTIVTWVIDPLRPGETADAVLDRVVREFDRTDVGDGFRLTGNDTITRDGRSERWMRGTARHGALQFENDGRFVVLALGPTHRTFVVSVTVLGPPTEDLRPLLDGFRVDD